VTSAPLLAASLQINYERVYEKVRDGECVVLRVPFLGYINYFHSCVKLEFPKIQNPKDFSITVVDFEEYPDLFKKWSDLIKAHGEKFCTCGLKEGIITFKWIESQVKYRGVHS
jgi:hypothetical protein